jgi:hypothetical protein
MPFDYVFPAFFAAFVGFFLYRTIRYKSLRGAMFGATVLQTVGEVDGARQGPVSVKLKVHVLGDTDRPEGSVGLELVARSFASWQTTPITLPRAEAQKLLILLQQATSVH